MIGRRLSHYVIVEPLAEGGMGVVYRGHDEHLDRDVAVKVLPPGTLADGEARSRFRREARALSRLQHPNILAVHDFDSQDDVDFLVMELVPGATLTETLTAGLLPEPEVVRLGVQIAEALEAAHEQGVIHRDLKPDNIMLTPRGDVKVLDFGLAKRLEPGTAAALTTAVTAAHTLVGTLPYMAPEQLLDRGVDARTDIYALGVVLYELATGRRPFRETQSFALAGAILNQAPPAPRTLRAEISPRLEATVLRCLEKDPAARFASARDVAAALRGGAWSRPPSSTGTPAPPAPAGRRARLAVVVAAGAVLVAAAGTFGVASWLRSHAGAPGAIKSLAVLPLANLSGDPQQDYFADGMTDELITVLAQINALKVISRTSVMKYKGTKKSLPEIARELHVDGILEGSVVRAGDQVRISAQLIQAATDRHLWTASYRRRLSNALELQDEVARAVAEQVRVKLTPQQRARLRRPRTIDPRALEAYLRGRAYEGQWTPESAPKAIEAFRRAIRIAPDYAAAHAGLASTYCMMSSSMMPAREAMPRAQVAALRALELDSTLALAHSVLGYVRGLYEWKWTEAEADFRRAIALDASEAFAHQIYGYILTLNGRLDEAIAELQRAHELDPLNVGISSMQLWPYNMGRRYEQAIRAARELFAADSTAWDVPVVLFQSYTQLGRYDEALAQAPLLRRAASEFLPAQIGYVYAKAGRTREARRILARAEGALAGPDSTRYGVLYDLAILRAALGDRDRAIRYLQRAMEQREEDIVWVKMDPRLDPLRSDPRFQQIERRLGFTD